MSGELGFTPRPCGCRTGNLDPLRVNDSHDDDGHVGAWMLHSFEANPLACHTFAHIWIPEPIGPRQSVEVVMKGEEEEGEERERSREGGEEPYSFRVPSSPWDPRPRGSPAWVVLAFELAQAVLVNAWQGAGTSLAVVSYSLLRGLPLLFPLLQTFFPTHSAIPSVSG